jgi:tRNA pseudouridine synthase 10
MDGKTMREQSVQCRIANNIKEQIFGSKEAILHAAGREDIDVRMLGRGRPFILELVNPKKAVSCHSNVDQLQALQENDLLKVRQFKIVDKAYFDHLKDIESSKAKSYCCIVWSKRPVTPADCEKLSLIRDLSVAQKTPIRVLHRRSQLIRDKTVHRLRAKWINRHYFELHVVASAGTYIKEFVHGDLGRTTPNICAILNTEADILQLDVTNVFESLEEALDETEDQLYKATI